MSVPRMRILCKVPVDREAVEHECPWEVLPKQLAMLTRDHISFPTWDLYQLVNKQLLHTVHVVPKKD